MTATPAPDAPGPLDGFTVVDATQGVAGGYAGRLLADLGARVIKVEPPGGDHLRHLGPFPGDTPDLEGGGLHRALNAGKESVVVDLDSDEGRAQFRALARGADAVLESDAPGAMARRGLAFADLATERPDLVYASHTPFGQDGPYAGWATSEIVDYAMGGYMYFSGHPEREPLLVPGHQGELHAGMQLATGTLLALWHAHRTGQGQHVDVSTFEAMLNAHAWLTTAWTHEGLVQSRLPSTITPCADGHFFWFPRPDPQFFAFIERLDLLDDPRFQAVATFREAVPDVREALAEWARGRTKAEIYHAAQEIRIPITPVNTVADLAQSPQLEARRWWRSAEGEDALLPGPPWNFSDASTGPQRRAPRLDEHAGLTLPARMSRALRDIREDTPALPLEGVRVLEVTANWAGPLAGRHLADMGADVIKVEIARKPATRSGHFAGLQQWNTPWNRAGYFNLFNRNKRDLVLDLNTPEGREVFLRLVDASDVVLENNSARVFPNLGLAYPVLAERNPRIIMCSMSGMGASGPEMHYLAYGSNVEASSGLVSQLGYGDGAIFGTGSFYADPICGTHGAMGIVAALLQRERTGRGQFIDMALAESGMAFQVEAIMDFRLNGRVAGPMQNRSRRIAPQGVYRCVGDEAWLAIGVETDEQWAAFCAVLGDPALAEAYPTAADRLAAQHDIDEAARAWAMRQDHVAAAQALQAAGVPAGAVLANWEIVSDPHLYQRGYFVDVVHPEVGHHRWDGYPWRLSATPGRIRMPAPLFAEHNDEVLRDVLDLSAPEIAALRACDVLQDVPTPGNPLG
ncbi:MAG: CoA transferase [Dehalococcoidia bacterium]|nr:CoA transferase [Dehalococcoidia bacterium]